MTAPAPRHRPTRRQWLAGVSTVAGTLLGAGPAAAADPTAPATFALPTGDAVVRGPAGPSEIVITTTARLAGAIHSLTWNGREFIDSVDHGRQLQSASNLDCGTPIRGETYNPTEAGSRRDGAGPRSSSRLLHLVTGPGALQTTTQMAFWLAPGERSGEHPAKNTMILSNHLLTKRVQIGYRDLPHVLVYDVTFGVPVGEFHRHAVFEAVTGYMPAAFDTFWRYDAPRRALDPLDDGPGEQARPVVLATASGSHAMGVYSPEQPSPGFPQAGYGRFRFADQRVVKWNCVFRETRPDGLPPGDYRYQAFVLVGDLEMVRTGLDALHAEFAARSNADRRAASTGPAADGP